MFTCVDAWMVPRFHTQPSIVGVVKHSVVSAADSRKPLLAKLRSNRLTLCWSSAMVFPPQYIMSTASLATTPSSSRSPRTRHSSSLSAVSDPGIPIAERAYTRTPRNGVTSYWHIARVIAYHHIMMTSPAVDRGRGPWPWTVDRGP